MTATLNSDEYLQTEIHIPTWFDAYDSHKSLCLVKGKIIFHGKEIEKNKNIDTEWSVGFNCKWWGFCKN